MKFKSPQDAQMFLVEIGRIDLLSEVDESFKVDSDLYEIFIKGRRASVSHLKSFRRSQSAKEAWRGNRRKYMKGIKKFHDSTDGKKFHRSLGRFLSTREFKSNRFKREANENFPTDLLLAVSSAKTHAYIELDYYRPLSEEVDFQIFSEDFFSAMGRIEDALTKAEEIQTDDLDMLACIVEEKALCHELSEETKLPYDLIMSHWSSVKSTDDECFLSILNHLKSSLSEKRKEVTNG